MNLLRNYSAFSIINSILIMCFLNMLWIPACTSKRAITNQNDTGFNLNQTAVSYNQIYKIELKITEKNTVSLDGYIRQTDNADYIRILTYDPGKRKFLIYDVTSHQILAITPSEIKWDISVPPVTIDKNYNVTGGAIGFSAIMLIAVSIITVVFVMSIYTKAINTGLN